MTVIAWLPPGVLLAVPLSLLLAQLLHTFWHNGRYRYRIVLALTVAGVALGQIWDLIGLPGLRLGQLDLLPAIVFAIAMQSLARRVSLRLR